MAFANNMLAMLQKQSVLVKYGMFDIFHKQ